MSVKINSTSDLINNADRLPTFVLVDINQRIGDWLASGGSMEDGYTHQQFRYAENVINSHRQ